MGVCNRITSGGRTWIQHHPHCPGRFNILLCGFFMEEEAEKRRKEHGGDDGPYGEHHHHHHHGRHEGEDIQIEIEESGDDGVEIDIEIEDDQL